MDLRQMRYFVAIVEAGSFSRAAQVLNVAQPALSQHVLGMEAELGTALLVRGSRGVQPTEAGLRLLDEARTICLRVASVPDVVRGEATPLSGEVRFGMPGTVSEQLGVSLVEATQRAHPGIRLRISEAMSGFVFDWLREGTVDVALLFDVADARGLTLREALSEEIVLFATPEIMSVATEPIALAEALRLPLVLPSPAHGLRTLIDAAALAIGARVHPHVEIDAYRQIKQLVLRGSVFGMLPPVAIAGEVRAGALRSWSLDPRVARRVALGYRTDRPPSSATRAVADLAWAILRDKVTAGEWKATWTGGAGGWGA